MAGMGLVMTGSPRPNRYTTIILKIFQDRYKPGDESVPFKREDIQEAAEALNIGLPKNLGDVVYTFRYRAPLPQDIQSLAGPGRMWIIRPAGQGSYRFDLVPAVDLRPSQNLAVTKIPDSTPGIIELYSLGDEQSLLARLRYNRLIDLATGLTCYSLQNHFRTSVPGIGQIETDEIYVGIDRDGRHYILPIQAKGRRDSLNIVQIEQDYAMCESRFPLLIAKPLGTQFIDDQTVAIFEFERSEGIVRVVSERHYRLVEPEDLTEEDILNYRNRLFG